MFNLFQNIHIDWLGKRKIFISVSILVMLIGLVSAIGREMAPGGTDAFNLGVDFKGGTLITVKFRQRPSDSELRAALDAAGVSDPVIQSTNKADEALIKIPLIEEANAGTEGDQNEKEQVQAGRMAVKGALDTFGKGAEGDATLDSDADASYKILGTDSVGAIAGSQLRNQAVAATLLGMVGILLFIAFRYDWTYAAGAVLAVFHDVIVVLAFFSLFQWEVNLTVIAAILTIVGFSVNDSIVIFDRVRENIPLRRNETLFEITNDSINQTLSRTVITSGLVVLSVLALVLFGGEVLRSFSLALLVGVIFGTYSSIAIASPISIWWQTKIGASLASAVLAPKSGEKMASASRRSVTRRPVTR
ncbi:MAG: protein translocase subunit SecF [Chloracidobacterium sp.]|nr:protein translocase subunit SecF [Chloracidobacterium sp.]MCC6825973.1 protein translocase subunit SecF [Acidobacteriota bacterium]